MATLPRELPEPTAPRALDRIVCAVDGGPTGAAAVREALVLAPCASRLQFVAVTDAAQSAGSIASLGAQRARRALDDARAIATAHAVATETELARGTDVAAALLARAGRRDLLVAGCAAGSDPAAAAEGSLVAALARRATTPLLVARAAGGAAGSGPRILAAVDDSPRATALVRLAGAIAAACHGHVHLVHVQGRGYGAQTRHRLAELSTQLIEMTRAEPVVEVAGGAQVAAIVCRIARDRGASLVVAGVHGGVAPRTSRPLGEQIAAMAPCSVLLMPAPTGLRFRR